MAHFRRRRQRKIFLRKKEGIQRANKYYWKENRKSAFHLYNEKVHLIIKHEKRKQAL
jgi:hypothetical protein